MIFQTDKNIRFAIWLNGYVKLKKRKKEYVSFFAFSFKLSCLLFQLVNYASLSRSVRILWFAKQISSFQVSFPTSHNSVT